MEQGQVRVAQSGLCVPLCPTRQQQQEDEVSKWKGTPWRGDRASVVLTQRPTRHTATILEHRDATKLAASDSLLAKKEASKANICTCYSAPINLVKSLLLYLLVKILAFLKVKLTLFRKTALCVSLCPFFATTYSAPPIQLQAIHRSNLPNPTPISMTSYMSVLCHCGRVWSDKLAGIPTGGQSLPLRSQWGQVRCDSVLC